MNKLFGIPSRCIFFKIVFFTSSHQIIFLAIFPTCEVIYIIYVRHSFKCPYSIAAKLVNEVI